MKKSYNGNIQLLSDHAANYHIVKQHMQHHTFEELEFYPDHDERHETPEYKKIHKKLVYDLDLPCLICGVKNSTLKNPDENPFGAKRMETHHHVVEWALQNAVDVTKFNKILRPHLAHRHPDKPEYQKDFTKEQIRAWVDHSEDNLWVLCDVHHRAKYLGIHEITFPIWSPMDLFRDDFEDWVEKEIDKVRNENQ